jgi:hypothetical protein
MHKVKVKTALELINIFWPDFVEIDGAVFVPWSTPPEITSPGHKLDYSELEYSEMEVFQNHVHMVDLFLNNATCEPTDESDSFYNQNHPDFVHLCDMGKKVAEMWFRKLKIDFPQYHFRVYYTQEDNPIVRFHRIRSDSKEYNDWLNEDDNLENIKLGKIIVMDTQTST